MVYVGAAKDQPGAFSSRDIVEAVRAHHTIATNGPLVEMYVEGAAGRAMIGDDVNVSGGAVKVAVVVRAPSWAPAQTITLWANSAIVETRTIPAGQAANFETEFTLALTRDTWVVAEVTGSKNMFPLVVPVEVPGLDANVLITALSSGLDLSSLPLTSSLRPPDLHPVLPFAITNPIWINVDGGAWTPPKSPVPNRKPGQVPPGAAAATPPDVTKQFAAAPGVAL
jgi:hypothetical protein